ncbi:TonB family protein [Paraburkholderia sp. DHOC27]|uniref:TonB family protein n=1 Tax=Paraburkholderia sp. DHOC27 TaxID=2303330 RepID=UPI0015F2FBAD|nr:TonB family protein [Paraburkholderia sp. DHOC27]
MATTGHGTFDAARRRIGVTLGITLGIVIAGHVVLLAWLLTARDRTVERTVEATTIVAALLRDEPAPVTHDVPAAPAVPAVAAPEAAAAKPAPVRTNPAPQPHVKQPRVATTHAPRVAIAPTPSPLALPSQETTPASTAPPVAAASSPVATATPAERAAPVSVAPKNVAHVDCDIPKPDYPDLSQRRNESGTAIVRFVVGLSGHIESAQLEKSSGFARLDDAALAAIHAGVCQPYRENGAAVRAAYSQSFVFGLSN